MIARDRSSVVLEGNWYGLNVSSPAPPKSTGGHPEEEAGPGSRTGRPCWEVPENVAALCSCPRALWQVELRDEMGYLAEVVSKQKMGDAVRLLPIPSGKNAKRL